MIANGSSLLFNATNNKVYFGDVTIVVPETWACDGVTDISTNSMGLGWADSHLRIGPTHVLFKDNPWTQQPRRCGQPGDFIYFSHNFILSNTSVKSSGKLLVHEWAKFRWGVFEEYGHPSDPIYPSTYHTAVGVFNPNYCSDEKISGTFRSSQNTFQDTSFSVVKAEPGDIIVFVLDYSSTMGQFIEMIATNNTKVGLVIFNNNWVDGYPLLTLDTVANRQALTSVIKNLLIPSGNKNLLIGISKAADILETVGRGTIALVTENLSEYTPNPAVVSAAKGHRVVPILYPCNTTVPQNMYDDLATIVPGTSVLTVFNKLDKFQVGNADYVFQSVSNYETLMEHLLTLGGNSIVVVAKQSCSSLQCLMILPVANSTQYESDFLIEVLHSTSENPTFYNVAITGPANSIHTGDSTTYTSLVSKFESLQDGNYFVNVSRLFSVTSVNTSLLATPKTNMSSFHVLVWSTDGLSNLIYTTTSVPTLFVMVTQMWRHVLHANVTAVITHKNGETVTLKLYDNGIGGDTTGNDGIYSAYLVGLNVNVDVSITVTATDNGGQARLLGLAAGSAPVTDQACCGSKLIIPTELLDDPGSFTVSSLGVAGRTAGKQPNSLPPAQITDLKSSQAGYSVLLTFTAPGDQLDQGRATSYIIQYQVYENNQIQQVNKTDKGTDTTVQFSLLPPYCDTLYTFTVIAISSQGTANNVSNEVRNQGLCSVPTPNLTKGEIAGIVIGSLLGFIIIIIIIYLCLKRDHLEDVWLWQMLTCRCIRNKKDDSTVYNKPPPKLAAKRSDIIRSNTSGNSEPIRTISDLYTKPNLHAKREIRKNRQEDMDDGGFGEHLRRSENIQMNAISDNSSQRSSPYPNPYNTHSTMPINQVGLPSATNPNYGYAIKQKSYMTNRPLEDSDDGSHDNFAYDGYSGNGLQPPRKPRVNTQV
ncbi:Calcium-activated chloride channel regulator 1-like 3 [Homarus americanus]|uniref:Calcium-activated chloride channel regulator 1-like 3 n=1 Tax=Homarus americanus TaxID=6706 RepID=A0A8J5K1C7_HOMAM|nr:Calcium-activated chloride channel regulator 1-like 3 [Homarus americanus]